MVREVIFRFQPSLLGSFIQPQPPIQQLDGIILLQRGEAFVGAWDADCFIHPANQQELEHEALAAILDAYPDVDLSSQDLRVFTCPEHLVTRFDFGAWQKEWVHLTKYKH